MFLDVGDENRITEWNENRFKFTQEQNILDKFVIQ